MEDLLVSLSSQELEFLQLNLLVDYQEEDGTWRVARVASMDDISLLLEVDGFHEKWVENLPPNSPKLAPFRRHTQLYTGHPEGRRPENADILAGSLQNHRTTMINYLESNFQVHGPYEIVQFLRGELFIFIDNVLTAFFERPTVDYVVEFLYFFIEFAVKYLAQLPHCLQEFSQAQKISPLLYTQSYRTALYSCHPEIIDCLNKLFGGSNRLKSFFERHSFQLNQSQNMFVTRPRDRFSNYHNQIVNNMNYFGSEDGFQQLAGLIAHKTPFPFPLAFIQKLLDLAGLIFPLMTQYFRNTVQQNILQAFIFRLDCITQKELKENDPLGVLKMIQSQSTFVDEQNQVLLDKQELKFAHLMLQSGNLEKKMKAVAIFKQFFQTSKKNQQLQYFRSFLIEHKVIENLLNENFHPEIFKRSYELFKFMIDKEPQQIRIIHLLWKALEYDEKVVLEMMVELSKSFNLESIEYLSVQFQNQTIRQSSCTDITIKQLMNFSINLKLTFQNLINSSVFGNKKKSNINANAGLEFMWELSQDTSRIDQKQLPTAIEAFQHMVQNQCFKSQREDYLIKCFDNLKKGISVPQSLTTSLCIFMTFNQQNMFFQNQSKLLSFLLILVEEIVQKYQKLYNLISLVITDLHRYMQIVKLSYKQSNQEQKSQEKLLFEGKLPHSQQIQNRLQFLAFMNLNLKRNELTIQHFKKLYQLLVQQKVTEVESQRCINFMCTEYSYNKQQCLGLPIQKAIMNEIFQDKEFMNNYEQLTPDIYKGIQNLFERINIADELYELVGKSFLVKNIQKLTGIKLIWNIAMCAQHPSVLYDVRNYLTYLYLRLSPENLEDNSMDFPKKILAEFKSSPDFKLPLMHLLHTFLINLEGKRYLQEKPSENEINILVNIDGQIETFQVPQNQTLCCLRLSIEEKKHQDLELFLAKNNFKISQEIQEEYSVEFIEKMRENGVDLIVRPSKNQNRLRIKRLKKTIANLPELIDQILSTLEIYPISQKVLSQLPIPNKLLQQIEHFELSSQNLFDNQSPALLQYHLKIILHLLPNLSSFVLELLQKNYVQEFLQIYYHMPNLKILHYLQQIFSILIAKRQLSEEEISLIFTQTLTLITSVNLIEPLWQLLSQLCKLQNQFIECLDEDFLRFGILHENQQNRQTFSENIYQLRDHSPKLRASLVTILASLQTMDRAQELLSLLAVLDLSPNQMECVLTIGVQRCYEASEGITGRWFQLIKKCLEQGGSLDPSFIKVIMQALFGEKKMVNPTSRKAAFDLLTTVQSEEIFKEFSQVLNQAFWKTNHSADWNLDSQLSKKKSYVGLKNLGCTCYMNSMIQQFLKIRNFSQQIRSVNIPPSPSNVLYQFQSLLGLLEGSQRAFLDTKAICNTIKDSTGQAINIFEQMDVDEFLSNFLDALEKELKSYGGQEKIIKDNFEGILSYEVMGTSCPHTSEREEPYLTLNLAVKNHRTIQECLHSYVQGEVLERSNAYFCETCDKKVSAIRRVCLKTLPDTLILVLKRFDINYDTMTKFKINDYCEFSHHLDMKPFTNNQKQPQHYFSYQLKGTVIHRGSGESGHYYSYIKDQQGDQWYEYNDTNVTKFDISRMGYEAFGGIENIKKLDDEVLKVEKNHNAYILIYQRQTEDNLVQDNLLDPNPNLLEDMQEPVKLQENPEITNMQEPVKLQENPEITKLVKIDQMKFQVQSNLVDQQLSQFLLKSITIPEFSKLVIHYYLTVVIRLKVRDRVSAFTQAIQKLLLEDVSLCEWFLTQFSGVEMLQEYIMDCPVIDMTCIITGLIQVALNQIRFQENSYFTYMIDNILILLSWSQGKKCEYLFKLLITMCGKIESKMYMLQNSILDILFSYFYQQKIPIYKQYEPNLFPKELGTYQRNKEIISQQEIDYNNAIILLVKLVQSLCFNQYFDPNEHIHYTIQEKELQLLNSTKTLIKLLNNAKNKRAQQKLGQLVQHISYQLESNQLINFLFNYLTHLDENSYSQTLKVLHSILYIKDSHQNSRVMLVVKNFFDFLVYNKKNYKSFETTFDYICKVKKQSKIAQQNKDFQMRVFEALSQDALANTIQETIGSSLNLQQLLQQKKWTLFKDLKYTLIPGAFIQKKWKNQINERLKNFRTLQRNFGGEVDFGREKSKKILLYNYYDLVIDNEVLSVQIVDELPGMINIKGDNYQKWLHSDTDLLQPHRTVKRQNHFEYYTLM